MARATLPFLELSIGLGLNLRTDVFALGRVPGVCKVLRENACERLLNQLNEEDDLEAMRSSYFPDTLEDGEVDAILAKRVRVLSLTSAPL